VPFLVAGLVVVGALTLLNLVFTLGVVRRLREHTALLDRSSHPAHGDSPTRPVDALVGDFTATTVDGATVSRATLAGETLVGFFSPGCEACDKLVPEFVGWAANVPGGRAQVLAVVEAFPSDEEQHTALLSEVAQVVVERPGAGRVIAAFGVTAFPALCVVDSDGRIVATGRSLDQLPVPARS
jgi:thiol-disulfide isomerase/thioredoxin